MDQHRTGYPGPTLFDKALGEAMGFDSKPLAKRGNRTVAQNDEPHDDLTAAEVDALAAKLGAEPTEQELQQADVLNARRKLTGGAEHEAEERALNVQIRAFNNGGLWS